MSAPGERAAAICDPLWLITDLTTDLPTIAPHDGNWTCEECGRRMTPRYITVPCCGAGYDCTDELDQPFCIECAPLEPGDKDTARYGGGQLVAG